MKTHKSPLLVTTPRQTRRRLQELVEPLEGRVAPAAILFIDYGDRFTGGTLATTQGGFRDVADDAVPANKVLGTTLTDANDAFNAGTGLNIVAQTFTALERAQILDIVQRAYLPLDIEIVELTANFTTTSDGRDVRGASSMAEVAATLRAGDPASRDAYIFVASFVVDPGGAAQITYGPGGGGNSPSSPTLGVNSDLADASNAHDDVAAVFSGGGLNNNTINNISHEAGHLLGLRHSITSPAANANINLYHQAEIMSYRNTNNTTSSIAFTRLPMTRGDNNTPTDNVDPVNFDDLAARNGQVTLYDQLRFDPNVGANPDFNFVSGSGLNDIITITRSGNNAVITVQPFTDAAYTAAFDMPGATGTTYSYSFPLTNSILIYAGDSNDRIVLDGDLGVNIRIDGMVGNDSLVVNGKGAADVVYTPDPNSLTGVDIVGGSSVTSFGGTIQIGGGTITFNDFETAGSVNINNVDSLSYQTPASGVDLLTLSSLAGGGQIAGSVNGGSGLVPFTFGNILRLGIDTGAANDTLTVDSTAGLIAPPNGIDYNGGAGFDRLNLIQTGGLRGNSRINVGSLPGSGQSIIDTQIVNFSNIEPVTDAVPAGNFSVGSVASLASLLQGSNAISYSPSSLLANGGRVTVDFFEPIEFTNKTILTVDAGAGSDEISLNNPNTPTGLTGITINAGDPSGSDRLLITGTAAGDTFTVTASSLTAGTVVGAPGAPVTYTGTEHLVLDGAAGDDTFALNGTGSVTLIGNAGVDTIDFTATPTGVVFDLDALDVAQRVTSGDALVTLLDRLENFDGTAFNDILFLKASPFARDINGGTEATLPPGDKFFFDGLGSVAQIVLVDSNTGTIKTAGYADVTFDEFETSVVTGSPGGGGFGTPGASDAFSAGAIYNLTQAVPAPGKPLIGRGPTAVVVGDVDGDGIPDMVTANSKSKFLSILLGAGDGTFGLPTNILSGGTTPTDLALADMDGDADLDIVVTNAGTKTVGVLLNAAGVFGAPLLTPKLKQSPTALAVGDVNGDLVPDVVVTHTNAASVSVFLTGAGGVLGTQALIKTGGKGTTDVVLGDFSGDGLLDIAAANLSSGNVSFLLNAGAGVFSVAPQLFKTGTRPSALAAADFNNDGRLDLAVSHSVSRFVGILIGNGAPVATFKPVLQVNTAKEHLPRSIAAGDFNGDGKIDLAMGPTVGGKMRVVLGVGNGDFSQPYEFDLGNKAVRLVANVTLADVNLDGLLDIVSANVSSNDISVLLRKA